MEREPEEVAFDLTRRDLRAFATERARRAGTVRRARRVHHFLWPAVFLVVGHLLARRTANPLAQIPFTVAAALWVVCFPLLLRRLYRDLVLRACREQGAAPGAYRLRAGPEALIITTPDGERRVAWAEVEDVETGGPFALVRPRAGPLLVVPLHAVPGGAGEAFLDRVAEGARRARPGRRPPAP